MSEPTIDEMMVAFNEQVAKEVQLAIIRAFVERVGAKYTVEHPTVVVPEFMQPWWDELAAMEKETNAGTND